MYTLEGITGILDISDEFTLDRYNAIRTSILEELAESLREFETVSATVKNLTDENNRLKAANAALYSKIERSFVGEPDTEEQTEQEVSFDDVLKDNVKLYMED